MHQKTEREKMLSGELYAPSDPELVQLRERKKKYMDAFNVASADQQERIELLRLLLGGIADDKAWIQGPFYCDYGCNIYLGKNFFANFNFTVLDVGRVEIGDDVMIAPNVQLLSATHPLDAKTRNSGRELGFPITIGNAVWLGGGVTVNPGVTIGDGVVVGSGSVVTKDLPPNVVAVGNPCRVIKHIEQ